MAEEIVSIQNIHPQPKKNDPVSVAACGFDMSEFKKYMDAKVNNVVTSIVSIKDILPTNITPPSVDKTSDDYMVMFEFVIDGLTEINKSILSLARPKISSYSKDGVVTSFYDKTIPSVSPATSFYEGLKEILYELITSIKSNKKEVENVTNSNVSNISNATNNIANTSSTTSNKKEVENVTNSSVSNVSNATSNTTSSNTSTSPTVSNITNNTANNVVTSPFGELILDGIIQIDDNLRKFVTAFTTISSSSNQPQQSSVFEELIFDGLVGIDELLRKHVPQDIDAFNNLVIDGIIEIRSLLDNSISSATVRNTSAFNELALDGIIEIEDVIKEQISATNSIYELLQTKFNQPDGFTGNAKQNISMNLSGNISMSDITNMLKDGQILNPFKVKLFQINFPKITTAIDTSLQKIEGITPNEAASVLSVTELIKVLGDILSKDMNEKVDYEIFGKKVMTTLKYKDYIFNKKATTIFSSGLEEISMSLRKSIGLFKNAKVDEKVMSNTMNFLKILADLIKQEEQESKEVKIFGKTIFKKNKRSDYIFNKKAIDVFNSGLTSVVNTISTVIDNLNKTNFDEKKIQNSIAIIKSVGDSLSGLNSVDKVNKNAKKLVKGINTLFDAFLKLSRISRKNAKTAQQTIDTISSFTKTLADNSIEQAGKNMKLLASGVAYLGLSILELALLRPLVSIASKTLSVFVIGIEGAVEKLANKKVRKASYNMKMLATGMATIAIASVAFAILSPAILVAVGGMAMLRMGISLLGNKQTRANIAFIGVGLATLGLAIWAFGELVNIEAIGPALLGLAALAGVLYLFNGGGGKWKGIRVGKGSPIKSMLAIAGGLALLALSIWVWDELAVKTETLGKVCLGLAGLATATWAFSRIKPTGPKNMLLAAGGIAALGFALKTWEWLDNKPGIIAIVTGSMFVLGFTIQTWNKVNEKGMYKMIIAAVGITAIGLSLIPWESVSVSTALTASIFMAGMGGIALIWNSVNILGPTAILVTAIGVGAMGFALTLWNKVDSGTCLSAILTMTGMGVVAAAYGTASSLILIGGAAMLVVSGSLLLMSIAMQKFTKTNFDLGIITNNLLGVGLIAVSYAALALPAVPAAVGATLMLPVLLSALSASLVLEKISKTKYNLNNIKQFSSVLKSIANAYEDLSLVSLSKSVAKSALLLGILPSTLLATYSISTIAKQNFGKDAQFDTFKRRLKTLQQTYEDLSMISLSKSVIKASMLAILTPVTWGVAKVIVGIQNLKFDNKALEYNLSGIDLFIDKTTSIFDKYSSKLSKIKDHIFTVAKLSNTLQQLAKTVLTIAKMEYTRSEVKNGKIVPVEICKLKESDFTMVGVGVGKMLNALIDPLVNIGEAKGEDYKVGPFTIPGKNKVKKGIEAIAGIGDIFAPLANIVKSIAESGILKDKDADTINNRLGKVVSVLCTSIASSASEVVKLTQSVKMTKYQAEAIKTVLGATSTIYSPVETILKSIKETGLLDEKLSTWDRIQTLFPLITGSLSTSTASILKMSNDSDINPEGVVQVMQSIGTIYDPLGSILKEIKNAGLLDEKSDKWIKFPVVFGTIVDGLTSSCERIMKFVKNGGLFTSTETNAGDIIKVMKDVKSVFAPTTQLLDSISKSGILDATNSDGYIKLKTIFSSVFDGVDTMMTKLLSYTTNKKTTNTDTVKKIAESIKIAFTPINWLIKSISESGALELENGGKKLKEVLDNIMSGTMKMFKSLTEGSSNIFNSSVVYKTARSIKIGVKPVLWMIDKIDKVGMLTSSTPTELLKQSINTISSSVETLFITLSNLSRKGIDKTKAVVEICSSFFTSINHIQPDNLVIVRKELDKIYSNIRDDKPWANIEKHFKEYQKSALIINKAINSLDLEKAVILKEIVHDVRFADLNGNVETLIERIVELIDKTNAQTDAIAGMSVDMSSGLGTVAGLLQPEATGETSIPEPVQNTQPDNSSSSGSGATLAQTKQNQLNIIATNLSNLVAFFRTLK